MTYLSSSSKTNVILLFIKAKITNGLNHTHFKSVGKIVSFKLHIILDQTKLLTLQVFGQAAFNANDTETDFQETTKCQSCNLFQCHHDHTVEKQS